MTPIASLGLRHRRALVAPSIPPCRHRNSQIDVWLAAGSHTSSPQFTALRRPASSSPPVENRRDGLALSGNMTRSPPPILAHGNRWCHQAELLHSPLFVSLGWLKVEDETFLKNPLSFCINYLLFIVSRDSPLLIPELQRNCEILLSFIY